jgi:SAM-dependent methyltransferase
MKLAPLLLAAAAALATGAAIAQDKGAKEPVNAGPYVPSPDSVVADMLKLADVGAKDFVIDLGSGNGKIVLTAAKVFGASGFGVEIQDHLVRQSNEAAKQQGVADRVKFVRQDLFKTDISQATVLTMYLLPNTVNLLKDKLLAELRPGTRIISHDYPLTGWIPETFRQMDLEEKVNISGVTTTLIYLYMVPAKAGGTWTATVPPSVSKSPMRLELVQQITKLNGSARVDGKDLTLEEPKLHGERITFRLPGRKAEFSGTVKGGTIEGFVEAGGVKAPWAATLAR